MLQAELKTLLQNSGIVGAGGAGFPSYMKLADGADILCINCAECEPLMYTDYMLMQEEMAKIVEGSQIVMEATGIKHTYIAIKEHRAHMLGYSNDQVLGKNVSVKLLPNVYPMGDEINLIYESTGRVIRPGNLPITSGVIVFNGETVYNIRQAVKENKSVTEKWVTFGGDLAERFMVRVPVGMRVAEILKMLGITVPSTHSAIDGGPSMGKIIDPNKAVITKTTKSILIIPNTARCIRNKNVSMDDMLRRAASACCGCTRCTEMCPRHSLGYPIEPHKMIRAALNSVVADYPELVATASLCCSCGVCAEVCCQEISPKDVILQLKGVLAKNKVRFVGDRDYPMSSDRPYRMIQSARWEDILGVHKYDIVPKYIPKALDAKRVEIAMSQHIGAPSVPAVSVGDTVTEGQVIANAGAGLSIPQHASISGRVVSVDPTKIVIEA